MRAEADLIRVATELRELAESGELGPVARKWHDGRRLYTFAALLGATCRLIAEAPATWPLADRWLTLNRMRVAVDAYVTSGPDAAFALIARCSE